MKPLFVATAIATFAFTVCPNAAAQDDVRQLNDEGIAAFQAERYAEAAARFRQAYELEPDPTLRKNEFVAWFKAGNCEKANRAAGEYLRLDHSEEQARVEAWAVIGKCGVTHARQAMAAGDLDRARSILDPMNEDLLDENMKDKVTAAREELDRLERQQGERDAEIRRGRETRRANQQTWGRALAGAGAAVLLGTAVYHIAILTTTLPNARTAGGRDEKLNNRLDTARWLVPALYAVGASSTVIGVFLLTQPPISPPAGPQPVGGGVTISWRF